MPSKSDPTNLSSLERHAVANSLTRSNEAAVVPPAAAAWLALCTTLT